MSIFTNFDKFTCMHQKSAIFVRNWVFCQVSIFAEARKFFFLFFFFFFFFLENVVKLVNEEAQGPWLPWLPIERLHWSDCAYAHVEAGHRVGRTSSFVGCAVLRLINKWEPAHDKTSASSCRQRRLWWDWADAQADLNLCWAHRSFCGFCHALAHSQDLTLPVYWESARIFRAYNVAKHRKAVSTWKKNWTVLKCVQCVYSQ